jgi:hypothetical protein
LALAGAWAQSAPTGSISGRVTDAKTGAGLHRAEVRIHADGQENVWGAAPTGSDGRYTLRALPPGRYRLSASKPRYQGIAYGAARSFSSGQPIVIAPGEAKSGVDFALPRFGVLTGTVYGMDGEAVPQVSVQVLSRQSVRGHGGWAYFGWAQTDDRGHFRFPSLVDGEYLVSCTPPVGQVFAPAAGGDAQPRMTYAPTYAPGAARRDEAARYRVKAGEETADADIRLLAVTPVKLTIRASAPFAPPEPAPADGSGPAPARAGVQRPPRGRPTGEVVQFHVVNWVDGAPGATNWSSSLPVGSQQELPGLEPGRYLFYASVTHDDRLYAFRETLNVDGDVEVTLDLKPAIDLTGMLKLEGGGTPAGHEIHLSPGDGFSSGVAPHAEVHADGTFVVKNVPPGVWDIGVSPMPKNGYYKSMQLGAPDAERKDVLRRDMTITLENPGPLEIVVGAGAAEVTGKVEGAPARSVLAMPAGANAGVEAFAANTEVDEQGNFRFRALTPGAYDLYAFEDLPPLAWLDPEFLPALAEYSVAVELADSAKESVTLTAIPARRVAALVH